MAVAPSQALVVTMPLLPVVRARTPIAPPVPTARRGGRASCRPLIGVAAILASAVLVGGCSQEVDTADNAPTAASLFPLSATTSSPGGPNSPYLSSVLYSERDAEIRARTRGVVIALHAELGDAVSAGQLLARLDDAQERAALAVAEATLELARLEHDRVAALQERNLIETAEADRARYRLATATAERDRAEALLEYTRIRAPFGGVVSRRFVRMEEMVEEASPLFRVTAPRPLRVRVTIPEEQALRLEVGQEARLIGVAGTASATIARIAPAVDPSSGSVEALLDVPRPGTLRPGSAVRVEWTATPSRPSAGPEPR
jgi:membrane fusion protein, multidrug efflux system